LAICDKIFGPNSAVRGIALNGLSGVLIYTGRYAEAEAALSEALKLNRKWPNPDNANVGTSLNNFGVLYRLTGQYGKAETAMRQAVAIDEKAVGADNPLTILNTVVLAQVLHVSGKNAAAEPIARRALAAAEKVLGSERQDHPALAAAQICLAEILRQSGRFAEAEALYRKALANGIKYLGPDHPNVAAVGLLLAKLLHDTGRDQEALDLLHHADEVAHVSGNQMIAWQVAGELMQIYAVGKSQSPVKAIFYGKEAVNDLQKLRGNLSGSSREAQQAFVSSAEVSAIYRILASLLISDGRNSEAQQVLTMVKEQEFYEFTQRAALSDEPKTVATLNSSEKKLADLETHYVSLGKEYGTLKEKFQKQGDKLAPQPSPRTRMTRRRASAGKPKSTTTAARFKAR
jgi:tetratricopeptide (TPR) repeat protein